MKQWLVSALVVGVAVAAVLAFKGKPETEPEGPKAWTPRPLTEKEVLDYLEVTPKVHILLQRIAKEFAGPFSQQKAIPEDLNEQALAAVELLLQAHGHTRTTYQQVKRRVERVVDAMRAERNLKKRLADIDTEIAAKEQMRDLQGEGSAERTIFEADLDVLHKQREAAREAAAVQDADRELAERHWDKLNALAPRTAPTVPRRPKKEPK